MAKVRTRSWCGQSAAGLLVERERRVAGTTCRIRWLVASLLLALVAACGGGGGSSTVTGSQATPPAPTPTSSVSLNATSFGVQAYAANLAPLPVAITASITNPPAAPFNYRVQSSGSAVLSAAFSWQSSGSGTLTISFPSPGSLSPGVYHGTVQLNVCSDAACQQPIGHSPATVSVSYSILSGSQPATSFTVSPIGVDSPYYTSQTTPIQIGFGLYVTNFPSSGLWLQVLQPQGGYITSLSFQPISGPTASVLLDLESPATLGAGIYSSSFSINLCYDAYCQNLVPGGPVNEPYAFIVSLTGGQEYTQQIVALPGASNVGWDSQNQQLYATTGSGGPMPDSLVQVDPLTGVVGPSLSLPVALAQLALSDDGQYAYVSSSKQSTVYRVELPALLSDLQIPLGVGSFGSNYVYQMQVAPGASQTLAISIGQGAEYTAGVAIFDGAVQRPDVLSPINSLASSAAIAWGATASTLYALRNAPAEPSDLSELDTVSVDAGGLTLQNAFSLSPSEAVQEIFYADGRIYGLDGSVRDAASDATLGQLTIPSGYQVITMMPDAANSRVFFLAHNEESSHLFVFVFSANTFALSSLADLGYDDSGGYPLTLILWGTDGIAFDYGGDSIMVLSGTFLSGSGGGTNAAQGLAHEARDGGLHPRAH